MALRYTFPQWAQRTVGSTEPAKVRDWFLERGLDAPRQTWRKFLQGPPASCRIDTWLQICEVTDEPLVAFLQIIPSGMRKPKATFRPKTRRTRKPAPKPAVKRPALPPRPSEFYARLGDA